MSRTEIKSEITGTVWKVIIKPGDKVASGDTLLIIESMKMEIPVIAEDGGTVVEIRVREEDPVAEGDVVAILEE
jgi:acetyl-CoA carboxylase biotin carboxyl carrier protein